MKRAIRIALLLITFSLLVVPMAGSQDGNVEQQIKTLVDQAVAATLKVDTTALELLLADDYTGIRGDGLLLTKAQEIGRLKSGTIKYDRNDVQTLKIRIYGHTAVATGMTSFNGITSGKPFGGTTLTTRVWVKRKGNWKLVSFQATRVSQ
jgi:hypothetical protein